MMKIQTHECWFQDVQNTFLLEVMDWIAFIMKLDMKIDLGEEIDI